MADKVPLGELRATVARMEAWMRAHPRGRDYAAIYETLGERFRADLTDERDELLSRGGALMLIQALTTGASDGPDHRSQRRTRRS